MNMIELIKSKIDNMTKSECRIATYFLENPNVFAFETLDDIATKIGTSTTSVIRFSRKVGFSGYKEFQDSVRSGFRYELTLPDKFKRTFDNDSFNSRQNKILRNTINCIEKTFESFPEALMEKSADMIAGANRVFCFGSRESFALAHYAYTRFLTVREDVFLLSAGQCEEIEAILSLKEGDVCVFFLFHRYTKQSLKILELLKKQRVDVILVTSPPFDEVESNATVLIPCFADINGIKNSAAAAVFIVDCLCNAAVTSNGDKTLDYIKKSEVLFKEFTF